MGGSLGWIAAGSLTLYVGAFAVGLGPVFWLLISEIYPLRIRGRAMSVATAANWGANLIVALTFLTLIQFAGRSLTFWRYGIAGICAWLFAWLLVRETKGRSLEQIEAYWLGSKLLRRCPRGCPARQPRYDVTRPVVTFARGTSQLTTSESEVRVVS